MPPPALLTCSFSVSSIEQSIDNHRSNSPSTRRPRVALAHDWLVGLRGGEHVLDAITRTLAPECDLVTLYTMFDDGRPLTPAIDGMPKRVSFLNALPGGPDRIRRWLLPLYPRAVAALSRQLARDHARQPIDLLISTSSAAIKGLRPPSGVPHICYCHTPARYLWSQADQYAHGSGGSLRSLGLRLFGPSLRVWDRRTAAHVTTFIANSSYVQSLIRQTYGRDSVILHPPVRTSFFTPPQQPTPRAGWLFVGALEPYKRVDLAIAAAQLAKRPLTIVGDGSMLLSTQALARSSSTPVTVRGRISDAELRNALCSASVLLYPQLEDFGITAVEAQSCGTPVAAFHSGGARDTVIPGLTGAFMSAPTPEALADAARACERLGDCAAACRQNALRFDESAFADVFSSLVRDTLHHASASSPG